MYLQSRVLQGVEIKRENYMYSTGCVYYALYMALLISLFFRPKTCMDVGGGAAGQLSSFMHLSSPSRVIKFLMHLLPHPPQYGP
jgi:hypothetical protein